MNATERRYKNFKVNTRFAVMTSTLNISTATRKNEACWLDSASPDARAPKMR